MVRRLFGRGLTHSPSYLPDIGENSTRVLYVGIYVHHIFVCKYVPAYTVDYSFPKNQASI